VYTGTEVLPVSTSQLAGITGVSHHTQAYIFKKVFLKSMVKNKMIKV
jgi:hypothetical protein